MEYVINKEQKQTVTGVRNELWQKLQKLNPDSAMALTYGELQDLVERLERVVQPLDNEDNRRIDELIDYYRGYSDEYGFQSVWSMWEDPTGKDARVWMCGPHPYAEGSVIEYDASMGNGKTYQVAIEGTLWHHVWKACDRLIELSGDSHHRFIEDLNHVEFGKYDKRLVLRTGS